MLWGHELGAESRPAGHPQQPWAEGARELPGGGAGRGRARRWAHRRGGRVVGRPDASSALRTGRWKPGSFGFSPGSLGTGGPVRTPPEAGVRVFPPRGFAPGAGGWHADHSEAQGDVSEARAAL